jgi:N-acetylglucosaminyl-diphospho-decaprenol L-rhamnosyltransferase
MLYYKNLSIIIVTYKSDEIIYKFVRKIPKKIKVIIVENTKNFKLKKNIEKKFSNIKVYLRKNEGVGSSLNFGVTKTKTDYFIHLSPDLELDFNDIKFFFEYAKTLKNNFCALGPRFLDTKKKGHLQIDKKLKIGKIDSIHGSYMFMNTKKFNEIGGWDKNIFLFFEETEYCYRAKKKNLFCYQINIIKTKTVDTTVKIKEKKLRDNWQYLLRWHFIWSKFYVNKKKFGLIITLLVFLPTFVRVLFRMFIYILSGNKVKFKKYNFRLNGLYNSMIGRKSFLRLKDI